MSTSEKEMQQTQDTAHYGYLRALYLSFYSSKLYVDVAKRWRGFGIIYLLLVIAIASIPFTYRVLINFNQYFDTEIAEPFEALPMLYIKDGHVILLKPMPFIIQDRNKNAVAIIDTTGTITKIDDTRPQLRILITRDKLYFRPPSLKQFIGLSNSYTGNAIYTHSFEQGINGVFYGKTWIESSSFAKLKSAAKFIIFPAITLIFLAISCICLLVFSTLGQLFSNVFYKLNLSYQQVFRLSTVASTALIFFVFIGFAANWGFPGLSLIYLLLIIGYFFYALSSVKRSDK